MNDITQLRDAGLGIGAETTPDQVGDFLARWMGFMATVREMDKEMRKQCVEWCQETRRNIPAGDGTFWFPSHKTDKSCNDVGDTYDALMEHTGGDVDVVKSCLSSDAWKAGACAAVLPDDVFRKLFTVEKKTTLKDGGKAEKQLVKVDPKYTKGGR